MGKVKYFLMGFSSCILVVACVSAQFPYNYYAYDIANHTLLGPNEKDDLRDSVCEAQSGNKYPCMCMMSPEFFKLKADDLKCHTALDACQRGPTPK